LHVIVNTRFLVYEIPHWAAVDFSANNILYTFALRDVRPNIAWNVILRCH